MITLNGSTAHHASRQVEGLRAAASRDLLEEFLELLQRHIRTEENELFEEVQKTLKPETLARVGGPLKARAVEMSLE